MVAVELLVTIELSATVKETSARSRSTILTSLTLPTFTPAIRMSSPLTTPVASENTALYGRVDMKLRLPISTTSTPVASVVTTMKMVSLTRAPLVSLSRMLIRRSPPCRPWPGPRSSELMSDIWSTGMPSNGAVSELMKAFCRGVPDGPKLRPDPLALLWAANPGADRPFFPRLLSFTPSFRSGRSRDG